MGCGVWDVRCREKTEKAKLTKKKERVEVQVLVNCLKFYDSPDRFLA